VNRLSVALRATMEDAEVKTKYAEIGSTLASSTPSELAAFIKEEQVKWGSIIRTLGLKSND
jgi:tripartite-type tricarboxylate transporter receptor subunit TctC